MSVEKDMKILKDAVERNMDGLVLSRVYDFDKYYLLVLDFKAKNDVLFDPFYVVSKSTYRLSGFSPDMNMDAYKRAIKSKPLYERDEKEE